jgi:hypothetical protein
LRRPSFIGKCMRRQQCLHFRAPSFAARSHISGNASSRSPELRRVYRRRLRVPVSGSRSARQCCAWQTVRGCCRQGVNRLRSKAVQGSIQREASALRRVACFWCQCERAKFGRGASCQALGLVFMLPSATVPLSESNGVHMQFQGKVVQAQRPYRQGQGQSQPNPSFKRTA